MQATDQQAGAAERCSWCGAAVADDDGFRLLDDSGRRRAVFCRLEHVIPWQIKGPRWEQGVGGSDSEREDEDETASCSFCDAGLGPERLVLTRHRGRHRIEDRFCDVEHLAGWAKAGGRFG